jgi:hypothetical protein
MHAANEPWQACTLNKMKDAFIGLTLHLTRKQKSRTPQRKQDYIIHLEQLLKTTSMNSTAPEVPQSE